MKGFEIIFIAPEAHRHEGEPVLDWIINVAGKLGIKRMTRRADAQGTGISGHTHSAHFFEQADRPEELMFVLDGGEADKLIREVENSGAEVFCIRRTIEYWQFGAD